MVERIGNVVNSARSVSINSNTVKGRKEKGNNKMGERTNERTKEGRNCERSVKAVS